VEKEDLQRRVTGIGWIYLMGWDRSGEELADVLPAIDDPDQVTARRAPSTPKDVETIGAFFSPLLSSPRKSLSLSRSVALAARGRLHPSSHI
jgi:hypothetical protein